MIKTKKQMALECVKAHHGLVKCQKLEEIRGNLLKTYKRYMRLSKQALYHKFMIAHHYNMGIMQTHKLYRKRPKRGIVGEVEQLREQVEKLTKIIEGYENN